MGILLLLLASAPLWASDELTVYELLAPSTHSFDIIFDVTAVREGSPYLFNPIREGSVASKERVIGRASGKTLEWEIVDGRSAKASEFGPKDAVDTAHYLRVKLPKPVPAHAKRASASTRPIPIRRRITKRTMASYSIGP